MIFQYTNQTFSFNRRFGSIILKISQTVNLIFSFTTPFYLPLDFGTT